MEYKTLGSSGLIVSRIALGMMTYGDPKWRDWVLTEKEARPIVKHAVEEGVNFFDTADMYSDGKSEEITGKLLKEFTRREEVVIATKVYFPVKTSSKNNKENKHLNTSGLSRKHIMHACDASLKRLGVDYIDLYQIHRWDPNTPIEETMDALNDLVRTGKVRYIGASTMYAWQFAKAQYVGQNGAKFISMQNHYNLIYREEEREMIPQCMDMGVGLIVWSPLARGFLTKPHSEVKASKRAKSDSIAQAMYYQDNDFEILSNVEKLSHKRGNSMAQTALSWVLDKPEITSAIIGASKISYLNEALAVVKQGIHLTKEESTFLESAYKPHLLASHR